MDLKNQSNFFKLSKDDNNQQKDSNKNQKNMFLIKKHQEKNDKEANSPSNVPNHLLSLRQLVIKNNEPAKKLNSNIEGFVYSNGQPEKLSVKKELTNEEKIALLKEKINAKNRDKSSLHSIGDKANSDQDLKSQAVQ